VAARGAGMVLCPTTEANLGDGLTDLARWLDSGVQMAIGSDSHVSRDAMEELRLAEYGQRLALRRRNVVAQPGTQPATAARLFDRATAGGAAAAGFARSGLAVGARADLLVADGAADGLRGVPPDALLDALVFAGAVRPWRDVLVGARWVLRAHRHAHQEEIGARFEAAMQELWAAPQ
jgi:formimidoylglutamate deiminase